MANRRQVEFGQVLLREHAVQSRGCTECGDTQLFNQVQVQVEGFAPVRAVADEDLERSNETKTSAVHFLRLELEAPMIEALKSGVTLGARVSHPEYSAEQGILDEGTRESLLADLD